MKRLLLLAIVVGCSSPPKPTKTDVPAIVPPPAAPEQTCKAGQTPGPTKRYEHGVRSVEETELGKVTIEASAKFPVEVTLGDKTFKIASPVRRCDGDGRMHFLGVQIESNGLRTIGFTPPPGPYDGFGAPANSCQIDPAAFCKSRCPDPKTPCQDKDCLGVKQEQVLYACSNPIMHELSRTSEAPTEEQKKRGITEVALVDRIVVREYEADIATGTWKSIVVVRETRRELVDPSKRDGG